VLEQQVHSNGSAISKSPTLSVPYDITASSCEALFCIIQVPKSVRSVTNAGVDSVKEASSARVLRVAHASTRLSAGHTTLSRIGGCYLVDSDAIISGVSRLVNALVAIRTSDHVFGSALGIRSWCRCFHRLRYGARLGICFSDRCRGRLSLGYRGSSKRWSVDKGSRRSHSACCLGETLAKASCS
jgi:hypothetical protein